MELRHLRCLAVLAEELHFSRAAERMGMTQPALTQQIQALERELGVRLFQRTKRSVHLTVAGKLTLEEALRTRLAKQEDGRMNFASSGIGSTHHLAAELFKKMTNVNLKHVPYRGAAPAMNDLIAGHVPILFDNLSTVIPQVEAGTVRALAVATDKRLGALPGVPTFAEAGLPGFEASSWFGMLAPTGTPPEIVNKVVADVRTVLSRPDVQKSFETTGAQAAAVFGADFGKFMKNETEKWADVIKTSGIPMVE